MKLYDNDSYREEFVEEVYKLLADDLDNSRANEIIDLFDNAPEFNPPNDPLTPDQLREMEGEPVWVEFEDGSGGLWGIVHIRGYDRTREREPTAVPGVGGEDCR